MRKITSFYYLNYPDDLPGDPIDAYSEIYVEIGDEGSTTDHFEETFALHVYTERRVKALIEKNGHVVLKSAIVVDRFEDNIIKNALYAILEDIEEYATQIGF